ncbi:MAG: PilZ domain-containing protein [Thermodesulfobacteriota bacterium]
MISITCKRCRSKFYTVSPDYNIVCPYCNFEFKSNYPSGRHEERSEIRKGCVIIKGSLRLEAEVVDISHRGVGVKIDSTAPLHANETIHITIQDLEIDADARVVWVKAREGYVTQTGLRFN